MTAISLDRFAPGRRFFVTVVAVLMAVSQLLLGAVPVAVAEESSVPDVTDDIPALRTATSRTVDNGDGTRTTMLSPVPINYRDASGAWSPIDTDVVADSAGGFGWRVAGNDPVVRFGATAEGALVGVEADRFELEMSLDGAAAVEGAVDGSTVTYADAFGGVDVEYTAVDRGVKEVLWLADADVPTSYRFTLGADRPLQAEELPDGGYRVRDAWLGDRLLDLSAPTAVDAAGVAGEASLEVAQDGNGLVAELAVDPEWLSAPGRVFPVELDPTLLLWDPTQDAYWNVADDGDYPNRTGYLNVGSLTGDEVYRSAVQFDLSALPETAAITSATLGAYYDGACVGVGGTAVKLTDAGGGGGVGGPSPCGTEDHIIDVHRIYSSWSPLFTTSDDLSFSSSRADSETLPITELLDSQWMYWDVSSEVRDQFIGKYANNGFLLKRRTEPLAASGPALLSSRTLQDEKPLLYVTYEETVTLQDPPSAVRSDGATLSWTEFEGWSGRTFEAYQVRRDGQLLATIPDRGTTTFRDTTAGPGRFYDGDPFEYTVTVLTAEGQPAESRPLEVRTRPQGQGVLQTQPGAGSATELRTPVSGAQMCAEYGAAGTVRIGNDGTAFARGLFDFDLSEIPTGAQISSATLTLHRVGATAATDIGVHGVDAAWNEGPGTGDCTGDGATWTERRSGWIDWANAGGDYDPTAAATVSVPASTSTATDEFDVTSLVVGTVSDAEAGHGFLLKAADESAHGTVTYASDDHATVALRPQLTVEFTDGNDPVSPHLQLHEPAADSILGAETDVSITVTDDGPVAPGAVKLRYSASNGAESTAATLSGSGTTRTTTVAASDFSGVSQCTPSYEPPALGTERRKSTRSGASSACDESDLVQLWLEATDGAGNTTTTAPITVAIAAEAAPAVSITSPQPLLGAQSGVVTVAASVDSGTVADSHLYVDGQLVDDDPTRAGGVLSFEWDTLDPQHPAYNGLHTVQVRAYNATGQMGADEVEIEVDNDTVDQYSATFEVDVPDVVVDSDAPSTVDVTVTNTGNVDWASGARRLVGGWYHPDDPAQLVGDEVQSSLGALDAGDSTVVPLAFDPPPVPAQLDATVYEFRVDGIVLSSVQGQPDQRFSGRGNKPGSRKVTVRRSSSDQLGLEDFYTYSSADVGGGMTHQVNVASGNGLLRIVPWTTPGRGLNTVLELTSNSREDQSLSPVGHGFSLGISGLLRVGDRLEMNPPATSGNAGNNWIAFTDADGTRHQFTAVPRNGRTVYDAPPGIDLYLREHSTSNDDLRWAVTRPDGVTHYFDDDGYPTYVSDANGNKIRFTWTEVSGADAPGPVDRQLTSVTDPSWQRYDIDYYTKSDAPSARVRGMVKQITDPTGSRLDFDYYLDGNLRQLIQRELDPGEHLEDGRMPAPRRTWTFTYTTSDLSGPAIGDATQRIEPDQRTPDQSSVPYSVRDPRGNETTFTYVTPANNANYGRVASRTARDGTVTSFTYDQTAATTTVAAPEGRTVTFAWDADGKVTDVTDAQGDVTSYTWSDDFNVQRIDYPTGKFRTFDHDDNGRVTEIVDELGNTTRLDYEHRTATSMTGWSTAGDRDDTDAAAYWPGGRTQPHVSLLTRTTDPEGVTTTGDPDDYTRLLDYDGDGNLTSVSSPPLPDGTRATTTITYNANGTIATITDANANATSFPSYHGSGQPTAVVDPEGNRTEYTYDDDGLLVAVRDARHVASGSSDRLELVYDVHHQLRRVSQPKSSEHLPGVRIHEGTDYDPNGNPVASHQPAEHDAFTTIDTTATVYDVMDRPVEVTEPHVEDGELEQMQYAYDDAGRLVEIVDPAGVASSVAGAHSTKLAYDLLDRVIRERRVNLTADGTAGDDAVTHSCYDLAGDLIAMVAPRANLDTVDCGTLPADHVWSYSYDAAHRLETVTDPEGRTTSHDYDDNGRRKTSTDAEGRTTEWTYDQRGLTIVTRRPYDRDTAPGREMVTVNRYDPVGNLIKQVTPRGVDADGGAGTYDDYVTEWRYDGNNRPTRIALPSDADTPQAYVHRAYDPVGNLQLTTLPTTAADLANVPDSDRTELTWFDTGWLRSQDVNLEEEDVTFQGESYTVPILPPVTYDYTAEGWQTTRRSEVTEPDGDTVHEQQFWDYTPDGQVTSITENVDRRDDTDGGNDGLETRSAYTWDVNDWLVASTENGTETGQTRQIELDYDGLGRITTSYTRNTDNPTWQATTYAYDPAGNNTERVEQITVSDTGPVDTTERESGRRRTMGYDQANWLDVQVDHGPDFGDTGDDRHIDHQFDDVGRETLRTITGGNDGTGALEQKVVWDFLDAGMLAELATYNANDQITERHQVSYLDDAGRINNGHRTTDRFQRTTPDGTGPCEAGGSVWCEVDYTYDARDRLVTETSDWTDGPDIDHTLDAAGNITRTVDGSDTIDRTYVGAQLDTVTVNDGLPVFYHYDIWGNVGCISAEDRTTGEELSGDYTRDGLPWECATSDLPAPTGEGEPTRAEQLQAFRYDYKDRVIRHETSISSATTERESVVEYVYDGLGRTAEEHRTVYDGIADGTATIESATMTELEHIATTSLVSAETQWDVSGTSPTKDETTSYGYDAGGLRLDQVIENFDSQGSSTGSEVFSFTYDVHGSVTQLVDPDTGDVAASYGYDGYGNPDDSLTDTTGPLSRWGWAAERTDPVTGTQGMGARRYGADQGRFLQADSYLGAVPNLNLSTDPLTSNRYAFAAGNPVTYIDPTGHTLRFNGSGTSYTVETMPVRDEYDELTKDFAAEISTNAESDSVADLKFINQARDQDTSDDSFVERMFDMLAPGVDTGRFAATGAVFFDKVRPGGEWDHKDEILARYGLDERGSRYSPIPGTDVELYFDVWSNVHYGYVGRAAGFTSDELLTAHSLDFPGARHLVGRTDVGDGISVQLGIDLYARYGSNLTADQLDEGIRSRIDAWISAGAIQVKQR